MAKKRNKAKLTTVLVYLILLAGGFCVGFFGAGQMDRLTGGNDALFLPYLALAVLGLVLAWLTQIVLHEAGHLVCGLLSGYRFVSFNVLGVVWQKDDRGRFRLGRMQIAGAGGQCLMSPPDYNGGDYPFTLYNLGGVLANLASVAVCALLAVLVPAAWLRILLVMQVLVALFFAALNGLPIPVAAIQNDCKNLLCTRKDADARRAFWVQMSVAAAQSRGLRLKNMPADWFAPFPEEALDNPIVCAVPVMNASRLMDMLAFPEAEEAIRALLAREKGLLGLYRMALCCDGAVCELIAGRPGTLVAALSDRENQQLMSAMKTNPAVLRTRYALALLRDRDPAQADALLSAFESAAKKHPYPQEIAGERELLLAIQAAL